ncbi:unnamed protein product [Symbiodinium sp. CCMP2592]|nr:unnamed protein product [Symbiodinium sp. CCMP2592]
MGAASELDVCQKNLDQKTFEAMQSEVEWDMKAFEVHRSNKENYLVSVRNQQLQHEKELLADARKAVDAYFEQYVTRLQYLRVFLQLNRTLRPGPESEAEASLRVWDEKDAGVVAIANTKTDIAAVSQRHHTQVSVVFANYTAPCLIAANHFTASINLMQHVMAEHPENEQAVMKSIANINLVTDHTFSLVFDDRVDARDERPLNYHGRLLMVPPVHATPPQSLWKKSSLLVKGRTNPAKQLPAGQMLRIEMIDQSTLPSVTGDIPLKGAAKYAQLGKDACSALVSSLFENVDIPSTMLVHLLDLVPDVGNMWQAFVQLQQTSNHALHYTAMLPDATSQEWFETTHKSLLVDQRPKQVPATALVEPAAPPLKRLVYGKDDNDVPVLLSFSEVDIRKWCSHPIFKDEFQTLKQQLADKYGTLEELKAAAKAQAKAGVNKRPSPAGSSGSQAKKLKIEDSDLVGLDDMKGTLLQEVPIGNAVRAKGETEQVYFVLRDGAMYICNKTSQSATVLQHVVLAAFGRGKWTQTPKQGVLNIPFELTTTDDVVMIDNKVLDLKQVLKDHQRAGEVMVAYHKTTPKPGVTDDYDLKKEHNVVFLPEENQVPQENGVPKYTQGNLALAVTPSKWETKGTGLKWTCRWTVTGLTPVRPLVLTTADIVLPAQKALLLS